MITVIQINPNRDEDAHVRQTCAGFGCNYKNINNVKDIPTDKEIIIFHPQDVDNPDWVKLEDFNSIKFTHPKDAYYIFGYDGGDICREIEKDKPELKDKVKFVRIPCKKGLSLHASSACAIALYDLYMENN